MQIRKEALVLLVVSLLTVAPGAVGEEDPWTIPSAEGVLLVARITASEKQYEMVLANDPPSDAGGPDRVELPLSSLERRSLTNCEGLVADGEHDKAEGILGKFIRKNGANWDALALRGRCRLELGRTEEAEADLRDALIGNRRNPAAWEALEKLAAGTDRRVVRPTLSPKGWVCPPEDGSVEFGYADVDKEGDFPWLYYATARAAYRHEGFFEKDFPKAKGYFLSFRETLFALGATLPAAGEKGDPTEELARLVAEQKAGTLVPFAFFALHTEPVADPPERDFEVLRPRLVKYFDEHILVSADDD